MEVQPDGPPLTTAATVTSFTVAALTIGAVLLGTYFVMSKRARGLFYSTTPRAESEPGSARPKPSTRVKAAKPPGYQLIDELIASDTILEAIRHMPAAAAVRLSRTSHAW